MYFHRIIYYIYMYLHLHVIMFFQRYFIISISKSHTIRNLFRQVFYTSNIKIKMVRSVLFDLVFTLVIFICLDLALMHSTVGSLMYDGSAFSKRKKYAICSQL